MKGAAEIPGFTFDKPSGGEKFGLVPSGNHRNAQRVIKSGGKAIIQTYPTKTYTLWKDNAASVIREKWGTEAFTGPVVGFVWIYGGKGFMESRDWDNVLKCLGDATVDAEILKAPEGLPDLIGGKDRKGGDDVRSIKGWRTWYFTRAEHMAITGGAAARKEDDLVARLFLQIVPASEVKALAL